MATFVKLSAVGSAAVRRLHIRSSELKYCSYGYLCEVVIGWLTSSTHQKQWLRMLLKVVATFVTCCYQLAQKRLHIRKSEQEYSSCGYLCEVVSGWLSSGYTSERVNKNTPVVVTFVKLSAIGSLAVTHQKSVLGAIKAPANMCDKPA